MTSFVNPNNTQKRPDGIYGEVISTIQNGGFCPFCPEHLSIIHPKPIFDENEHWLATENAYPYENTSHHLLFIHRKHVEHIDELSPEQWSQLGEIVVRTTKERKIKGATLLLRFGDTSLTGASVSHLHAQLISGTGDLNAEPVLSRVG